jgi:outer membrane biosynthesis protein TonB
MTDHDHGAPAQTDEERARAVREQLKSVHAFDLAYEMAISLVSFGYQKMGLTDETRELRDLDDARLAIELLRAVTDTLDRQQAGAPTADLHATLAQMQLSYVRALEATPAPAAGGPEPPTVTPAAEAAASKEPPADDVAPKKAAAGKPARKKPAPKKPAPKKPAVKKPAAKKPAPRKPRGGAPPSAG